MPSSVPSLFSAPTWAERAPTQDAVAEAAPAPAEPLIGEDTAATEEPGARRRSGLMMPGDVATPLQEARSGGASVTETEAGVADAAVTAPQVTAARPMRTEPFGDGDRAPAPLSEPAPAVGAEDTEAAQGSILDGQPAIMRLPFGPSRLLWPLDEVAELLTRGLASRLDNVTGRRADRRGLFNPSPDRLDAPRGLAVALTGPLGVGKTTIALAHAHRQLPQLDILWWARGSSEAELRADLRALANAVGLDTSGPIDPLAGLRRWLERCQEGWLLVVDDLDPSVAIGSLLPRSGRGQIVITTAADLAGMDTVAIRPPSAAAARRALQDATAPADDPAGGRSSPVADTGPRDTALDVLGARLANQPWALTLAAHLLATEDLPAAALANALNDPPAQPLLTGSVDGAADAQLLTALDRLTRQHGDAVPAMLALSALGGTVPVADVHGLRRSQGSPLDQPAASFVADAARWSLLISGDAGLAVVPAVSEALRRLQTTDAATAAWTGAAQLILAATHDHDDRAALDRYGPLAANLLASPHTSALDHIAALQAVVAQWSDPGTALTPVSAPSPVAQLSPVTAVVPVEIADEPPRSDAPSETGAPSQTGAPAQSNTAEPAVTETAVTETDVGRSALGGAEPAGTPPMPAAEAPTSASSANASRQVPAVIEAVSAPPNPAAPAAPAHDLQELRQRALDAVRQGDPFGGARHFEELVAQSDAAFGSSDVRSLSARTELASALAAGGGHHRAHQLLVQVLDQTRATNGEQHPATLAARHNLANNHADLGRHREALALRQSVFDGRLAALGAEHPQTVSALANLANSLALLGRAEDALQARERVAELRQSALGEDNAQTLGALNNLANSYAEVGRHGDALELRQRVLASRERQLGPDHQHTITARNNLANSLTALGRHPEALRERERTLLDCERVLGVDHPLTITARANLTFSAPPAAQSDTDRTPTPTPAPALVSPQALSRRAMGTDDEPFAPDAGQHDPSRRSAEGTLPITPPPGGMWSAGAAGVPTTMAPPPSVPVTERTPGPSAGVPWSPPRVDAGAAPSPADAPPAAWIEPPPRKRRFWFFLFRR